MGEIVCYTCGKVCANIKELALHIIKNKRTHKVTQRIRSIASDQKRLDRKLSMKKLERTPLTDEDRIAKEDTRRELSGNTKLVPTICPRCKVGNRQPLEVEHAESPQAWKLNDCFLVLCEGCR